MWDSSSASMGSVWTLAYENPSGNSVFSKADIPGASNRHSNQKTYFFSFLCIDNFVLYVCMCAHMCVHAYLCTWREKRSMLGVSYFFPPDFVSQRLSLDLELALEARLVVQDAPKISLALEFQADAASPSLLSVGWTNPPS